jgi:hypothetical protein
MSAAFPEATADVEKARQALRPAEAFFLAHLANIVGDMTGLTAGDEEFDYFIPVPVSRLHELSPQISDLQLEVQERFGISLSAMPIPMRRTMNATEARALRRRAGKSTLEERLQTQPEMAQRIKRHMVDLRLEEQMIRG